MYIRTTKKSSAMHERTLNLYEVQAILVRYHDQNYRRHINRESRRNINCRHQGEGNTARDPNRKRQIMLTQRSVMHGKHSFTFYREVTKKWQIIERKQGAGNGGQERKVFGQNGRVGISGTARGFFQRMNDKKQVLNVNYATKRFISSFFQLVFPNKFSCVIKHIDASKQSQ